MATGSGSSSPPAGSGAGRAAQVRQEATRIGQETARAGGHVAQQAVQQGWQVAGEARHQAQNLLDEASAQARGQARQQQQRTVEGLRTLGEQLRSMADSDGQGGLAAQVVARGADAAEQAAGWLDQREPGQLLDEVRDYARRHPGVFLAGAAIAGLLVGRLGRSLTAADGAPSAQDRSAGSGQPRTAAETGLRAPSASAAIPVRHGPTGSEVGP